MIAADAHKRLRQVFPDALTLIAPRHPERGEAILRQLEAQGLVCALRSRGDPVGPGTAVYVCDTIGELGLFYRLAGVVFVGKSFVGGGGQNPIEPAKLACAILHGPMVANFADAYAALDDAGGALAVARPEDLGETLIALFADAARLRAMARAAGDTVERRAGAVERSMRALEAAVADRRGGAVKAPGFWAKRKPTLLARAASAGRPRSTGGRPRGACGGPGERARAPTICVGNFVAGGAGKTPAAIALARMLIANGRRVAFLSRGYGGAERVEPLLVDANAHTAAMVGDEPLLLARIAPCWVGADRVQKRAKRGRSRRQRARSRRRPAESGARQGPRRSPWSTARRGFGNGLCVPAGPLRAPVAAQLPFVRALIVHRRRRRGARRDRRRRRRASRSSARASSPTRSPPRR